MFVSNLSFFLLLSLIFTRDHLARKLKRKTESYLLLFTSLETFSKKSSRGWGGLIERVGLDQLDFFKLAEVKVFTYFFFGLCIGVLKYTIIKQYMNG